MFITYLRFAANRAAAPAFMAAHNAWIERGFAEGAFLGTGSITGGGGGVILARGETRADHEARLREDPFVAEGIVTAETEEVDLRRTGSILAGLSES